MDDHQILCRVHFINLWFFLLVLVVIVIVMIVVVVIVRIVITTKRKILIRNSSSSSSAIVRPICRIVFLLIPYCCSRNMIVYYNTAGVVITFVCSY